MKKLIPLILIFVLAVSFSIPALASEDGNAIIRARLAALKASALSSNQAAMSAISDIEGWLAGNTIDVATANTIVSNINTAVETAGGATSLEELNQTQVTSILNSVTAAASAADLNFSYNLSNGSFALTAPDGTPISSGRVDSSGPVQQTGIDTTVIIIIAIGITLLFAISSVVAVATRKKILVNVVS